MKQLLKQYFGYEEFRPLQEEIIHSITTGKDTFVLMPTGGGKSLCYQLPALYFEGLTLVISPLIALMKDQVDSLRVNGIKAAFINSSLSYQQISEVEKQALSGDLKILYVAPERLAQDNFRNLLQNLNISLIAIDEAHCISEWGHDFRPDYRNLSNLRDWFSDVPIIALTATATEKVEEDIKKQIKLKNPRSFKASFDRPNLNFIVLKKKQVFEKIRYYLDKHKDESAIIYCFSRKHTENLADQLNEIGYKTLPYHAGLNTEERKKTQDQFINDDVNIITATIAFGMGIDKSNIRLVIHHSFPKSMEGYYQEVGRAGRDGLVSDCVMLFGKQDWWSHKYFTDRMQDPILKKSAEQKVNQVMRYAQWKNCCRRRSILSYFGEIKPEVNCQACDICLKLNIDQELEKKSEKRRQELQKANTEYDSALFETLRKLRKEIASENGVPPYVIFGDRTLQEMAYYYPRSEEEFLKISGVANKKLENFGKAFLGVIDEYCQAHHLESKPILKQVREKKERGTPIQKFSEKYNITLQMLQNKKPLPEIARQHGIKESSMMGHLERMLEKGYQLQLDYLKPKEETYKRIKKELLNSEDGKLKPIFEKLDEEIPYEEIRLVKMIEQQKES